MIEFLQQYGFTKKEASVYLTGLRLGSCPASTISRHTNIDRGTTYSILKKLISRGIASSIKKSGSTYFSMITPEELQNVMEHKLIKFKSHVPELMSIIEVSDIKPKIEFFEGIAGVKKCYIRLLQTEDPCIKAYYDDNSVDKSMYNFIHEEYIVQRIKRSTHVKVILSNTSGNRKYHQHKNEEYLKESIIIDDPLFKIPISVYIYDKEVSIFLYSADEMSAMIIHSKQLSMMMDTLFEYIWRNETQ